MSWDFYKNKKVVARKEYTCDWFEHVNCSDLIKKENGKWVVDRDNCLDMSISEADMLELQAYCDCDFKIKVGELHNTTSGKFDGVMCTFRGKISISDLMHRNDLVYED